MEQLFTICQDFICGTNIGRLPIHHEADLFTIAFSNGVEETLLYIDDGTEHLDHDEFIALVRNNGIGFTIDGTRAGQGNLLTSRLLSRKEGRYGVVRQYDLFGVLGGAHMDATYEDRVLLGMVRSRSTA